MNMGYLAPPGEQRGGYASQFKMGMGNPAVGGIRRPTGRVGAGDGNGFPSDYGLPVDIGRGPGPKYIQPDTGIMSWKREPGPSVGRTPQGPRSLNKGGSGFVWDKKSGEHASFNEPGIPELRDLGDVERFVGEKWSPDRAYDETNIDPSEMIESRFALIDERLGGEMSEAARRFGQSGALMSGGGLGGVYAGTLAESERGAMRDKRQIASDRIYAAQQAEAERRARAFESEQGRSLAAHEGFEGRRLSDVEMGNKYGLDYFDRQTDYDWDKYGAELGAAGREQEDAIAAMLAQYGM